MDWHWKTIIEPFKIKSIEPLGFATHEERKKHLEEAGYNLFKIPADKVLIDLLTDSGTAAMSAEQWGALMRGDESYAGARSFYTFESVIKNITGYSDRPNTTAYKMNGKINDKVIKERICELIKI